MTPEISFDFISDEGFRSVLESDYREMRACAENGAYKAVHVLAGSLVEAVLVDYLAGIEYESDPLEMSFAQLITASKKAGALNQRMSELSSALKSFRNLIHPGRLKRLEEEVDADSAAVAQSLVAIIVRAVAASQEQKFGLTAQQIITKFESDPSAFGVAEHLLRATSDKEVARLLLTALPERYFELLDTVEEDSEVLAAHSRLFRAAFSRAPDIVKKRVLERYVTVLREEPGPRVEVYEEQFFRGTDLDFVREEDRGLVRDHLLARLRSDPNANLLRAVQGFGGFLEADPKAVRAYIDPIVRAAVYRPLAAEALLLMEEEVVETPSEVDPLIIKRLDEWEAPFDRRGDTDRARIVREIKGLFEVYVGEEPE